MAKEIFTGMTAKQKGMIGAIVVIALVILWQVIGLIGGSGSTPPAQPPMSVANKNSAANKTVLPRANNHALQQNQLQQATVASDTRFLQLQQMSEQKYIGKLNDLEDLKIQREIAETNQAIATAKLATVTAEKNISDLLTKPAVPEIPIAAYANKLAGPNGEVNPSQSSVPTTPTISEAYTIISVSMQLHKWSAIIGYQGKLFTVAVGDVLAPDNSVVMSINKNGVTLKKDDKIRKISITSSL